MPARLAEFFVRFLTDPGDLVLDPFAGSNTTGFVAERLARKWIAFEKEEKYIRASQHRFDFLTPSRRETRPKLKTRMASNVVRAVQC